jgi:sugar transferase EpsL
MSELSKGNSDQLGGSQPQPAARSGLWPESERLGGRGGAIRNLLRGLNTSPKVKRALDLAGASIGLIISALPIALLASVIRVVMGPPVLFRQERPGLKEKDFVLYKFRTMTDMPLESRKRQDDRTRLTALGEILRRTSLDELPELLNVVKGDLSLVGPRPLLPQYVARYTPEQARRHEVKPGITGWAQVNGRNALAWEEKFAFDVWYVDNWTVGLDIKILWMTLRQVASRQDITAEGHVTMPEFMGSDRTDGESE